MLLDPFAHAGDSDSGTAAVRGADTTVANADAVVGDFERHGCEVLADAYDAVFCFGVAMNVGERFLDDAKQSDFEFARQARMTVRHMEANAQAGTFGEAADVSAEGRRKTGLLKHRRVEQR